MGRLIDADALIEEINNMPDGCNLFRWRSGKKVKAGLERIISKHPTAYDVDAVVAALEKKLKNLEHNKKWFEDNQAKYGVSMCVSEITAFKIAIDIVRKGGIDGKEEKQA